MWQQSFQYAFWFLFDQKLRLGKKDGVIDQIRVTDLSIYYVCNFLSFTFMVTMHYAWNVDVDMVCETA